MLGPRASINSRFGLREQIAGFLWIVAFSTSKSLPPFGLFNHCTKLEFLQYMFLYSLFWFIHFRLCTSQNSFLVFLIKFERISINIIYVLYAWSINLYPEIVTLCRMTHHFLPQVGRVRSLELSLRARRGKADHEAETLRFNLRLGCHRYW